MPEEPFTEKEATSELARAKKLAKAKADLRKKALSIARHLETEELPDENDLLRLHKQLKKDEHALAKLLKPAGAMPKRTSKAAKKRSKKR